MKELLLLRHAKSSWDDASLADHDRPLNQRGRVDAPRIGRLLRREGLVPDWVISSTARRAVDTAEAVADACGFEGEVHRTRQLYGAGPAVYLALARACTEPTSRLMLVGHNPGIEQLVETLSGVYERMPTAALAHFRLTIDSWTELTVRRQAHLVNVWLPRELTDL